MTASCDIAIIGAGPAGMSAALEARAMGLSVAVFDEQPGPGGQVWRDVLTPRPASFERILGADYLAGRPLAKAFMAADIRRKFRTTVWHFDEDGLSWRAPDGAGRMTAARILVATGAMERPVPLNGWTRPGVMSAGAAQILLKTEGAVAEGAVFVGNGPLLFLVACQYLAAGVKIGAILETRDTGARRAALRSLPAALGHSKLLWKGAKMLARLRAAGVRHHRGVRDVVLEGTQPDSPVSAVSWAGPSGTRQRLCTDHVFLHQGVVPNMNTAMAARAEQVWNGEQSAWVPERDTYGRASLPWLLVAGDAGGIGGAEAACLSGRLAAFAAARDLGRIKPETFADSTAPLLRARANMLAPRPFLDRLYRPDNRISAPSDDDVTICRCEEVRRATLAQAITEGCPGPNQFKSFSRAGMGPCQGRLCGATVQAVMSNMTSRDAAAVGYYRLRMPLKPVTLGDIASAATASED